MKQIEIVKRKKNVVKQDLRAKHPETAYPDKDPVRLSSELWPRPQDLEEHWSSDAGIEFLDKWFGVAKICQYFRTRSPVTMPDIDGWHARDLIAPLFFKTIILNIIILFAGVLSSLT